MNAHDILHQLRTKPRIPMLLEKTEILRVDLEAIVEETRRERLELLEFMKEQAEQDRAAERAEKAGKEGKLTTGFGEDGETDDAPEDVREMTGEFACNAYGCRAVLYLSCVIHCARGSRTQIFIMCVVGYR